MKKNFNNQLQTKKKLKESFKFRFKQFKKNKIIYIYHLSAKAVKNNCFLN